VAVLTQMLSSAIEDLRASIQHDGEVLLPTDPQYGSAAMIYQARYQSKPALIVQAQTSDAVAKSLLWAAKNSVKVQVKSAGNSFEALCSGSGLMLDLGRMTAILVNAEAKTAELGAGCRLGDVYKELDLTHGLVLPAGSCPPVAVSGLVHGGGHGYYARKWGLTSDHLIGAEVVTPDGKIRDVSAAGEDADLFWAIRGGGGGSFGIVTKFRFQLRTALPVIYYRIVFSVRHGWEAVSAWQNFMPYAPDEMSSTLHVSAGPQGLSLIAASGEFIGSPAEFEAAIAPLRRAAPIDHEAPIQPKTLMEAVVHFAGGSLDTSIVPVRFKGSSDYFFEEKPMNESGYNAMIEGLGANGMSGVALFDAYGGAIDRVATADTAFAHRVGALYCIQYYAEGWSDDHDERRVEWMKNLRKKMAPFVSGHCYVSYCDLSIPDAQKAYYGTNLPRLRRIKAKYDPDQIVQHAQSVVPDAEASYELDLVYPDISCFTNPVTVGFHLQGDELVAQFKVRNPNPSVRAGQPDTVNPTENLYESEVVELFVSVTGMPEGPLSANAGVQRFGTRDEIFPYYEFELSPRNEFLEVRILSPKKAADDRRFDSTFKSGMVHSASESGTGWEAEMRIPLKNLGWDGDPMKVTGNAFAILGPSGSRSYWSLFLPRQIRADFHKPRYFERLLTLEPVARLEFKEAAEKARLERGSPGDNMIPRPT
jgi:FAD/FMN-containing dehydrogenase